MTDIPVVEVLLPTTDVTIVGLIPGPPGGQGDPGNDGTDGVDGSTGPAGPDGVPSAINVLNHSVVGDATTDDTAALQTLLAGLWPYSKSYYLPTAVGYKVSDTLTMPVSSDVYGDPWQSTRIYPAAGMAVPVFDMSQPGVSLHDIAIWNFVNSGSAGTPAIVCGGQQQKLYNIDVRSWKGRGVDVTIQNFSHLRNVNVSSCVEDGFTVATTYTLLEGCTSNGNGGNGFTLKDSLFANGSGSLVGCVSEGNTGHGYYVVGGDWDLAIYGESNGGHLLHVDGTQQFDTSVTLAAPATAGDTHITVAPMTKGLPAKSILRFGDGTVAVINNNTGSTTVALAAAITADQINGAVATLAPEDIHPSRLPTVRLRAGTHDGSFYFHACNFSIDAANFPISADIVATPSARLVGEPFVKGRSATVTVNYGGGGSRAVGAVIGSSHEVISHGLSHTASPIDLYQLAGNPGLGFLVDPAVPGGFYHRCNTQFQLVATANGWKMSSVSLGSYSIRALVRDVSQTASNISLIVTGGSTTTFTARTNTWEWISVDHTQTESSRTAGTAGIAVQRLTTGSNVDVAAIIIVPNHHHVVLPGTWQNPTHLGSNSTGALWIDGSGHLRFKSTIPTGDTDGTSIA